MSLDFSEFTLPDKEQWKNKIQADLKGKRSYEDLNYVLDGRIMLEACQYSVSSGDQSPLLFRPCGAGADIRITDSTDANKAAHQLLQTGIQSVHFKIDDMSDAAVLLRDIQPQYVQIGLDLSSCSATKISEFKDYIFRNFSENTGQFIINYGENSEKKSAEFRDVCGHIHLNENIVGQLIQLFKNIHEGTTALHPAGSVLFISAGHLIPDTISALRAVRILDKTVRSVRSGGPMPDHSFYISLRPDLSNLSDDLNIRMIQMTYIMFAAYAGGADMVLSLPVFNASDQEYARLSLNIPHLFNEESKLNRVSDPFAGSYFIENATNALVEQVMNAL
jgi:methylmalonyl-CoA mutase